MIKSEFITKVLSVINETGVYDAAGGITTGADETRIDRLTERVYRDAWRRAVKIYPKLWFRNETFHTAEHFPNLTQGTGFVKIPADFYLLTSFRMRGWMTPVYEAVLENSHTAELQQNEYTRGESNRPVCVIGKTYINYPPSDRTHTSGLYDVLYYYSLPKSFSEHKIEDAIYLPIPEEIEGKPDTYDMQIAVSSEAPLIYLTASLVLTVLGKVNESAAIDSKLLEMLPGYSFSDGNKIITKQ